jgi:glutamine synthetase type III
MSNYPTLIEMGVQSIDDIYKYSLRQEGNNDVLKIYFRRTKGSLLPKSKKFKFGRSVKTHRVDSSTDKYREVSEMSAFLMKAVDELHKLVQHEHQVQDVKERLLNDIEHLEKVVMNKLKEMRRDIEQIK